MFVSGIYSENARGAQAEKVPIGYTKNINIFVLGTPKKGPIILRIPKRANLGLFSGSKYNPVVEGRVPEAQAFEMK